MSNHQFNQPIQHAGICDRSMVQDHVSIYIENMLRGVPATSPEHSIFRVLHQLRQVNEKAYEPVILAIGPYHHGNDKFKFMEEQKRRYLRQLLRREEGSVDRYVLTLRKLEQWARNCYAETIDLSQEKFLAMMLIDGYFIVEFFRRFNVKMSTDKNDPLMETDENDPLMESDWLRYYLRRDLLLLENQLPLFVLTELYDLTKGEDEDLKFHQVAIKFLKWEGGGSDPNWTSGNWDHLLHLYYAWRILPEWSPLQCKRVMPSVSEQMESGVMFRAVKHLSGVMFRVVKHLSGVMFRAVKHLYYPRCTDGLPAKRPLICEPVMPSAIELMESGVRFKAVNGRRLGDIKFENGTLEIPVLFVEDFTESEFRNLIAYEQHGQSKAIDYFSDYAGFMDCLINSSKDVKMLRRAGIIQNYLGDDEVVAQMFNKMCDNIISTRYYYSKIFQNLNAHFGKRSNFWKAKLRREYFHSPWAFLSVVAAIMLLLLTAAQTVFTVLSYTKQS